MYDPGRYSNRWYHAYADDWEDEAREPQNGRGDPVRLDYVELWGNYSIRWLERRLDDFDDVVDDPTGGVWSGEKDVRTNDICDAAKDAGIIVFAIGFETDYHGDETLRDCASSDAHFFDVEGLEIEQAFRAISSTINRLRLSS